MSLAQIFMPIRHPEIARQAEVLPFLRPADINPGESRDNRVEVDPVTNTPPPGPLRSTKEEGWLALLELVFETTGWPDAEDG
jgi:hypothetical protein